MGTLTAKMPRHPPWSSSQPPTKGPAAAAIPESPAHVPMALARSFSRKLPWMMASPPGVSRAAPMPWSTRAPMSWSGDCAAAHSTEARANHVTPTT